MLIFLEIFFKIMFVFFSLQSSADAVWKAFIITLFPLHYVQ